MRLDQEFINEMQYKFDSQTLPLITFIVSSKAHKIYKKYNYSYNENLKLELLKEVRNLLSKKNRLYTYEGYLVLPGNEICFVELEKQTLYYYFFINKETKTTYKISKDSQRLFFNKKDAILSICKDIEDSIEFEVKSGPLIKHPIYGYSLKQKNPYFNEYFVESLIEQLVHFYELLKNLK